MSNLAKNRLIILSLISILVLHTVIIFKLMFFPYMELFVYPYLTNQGLKPYSQIFDQHFPGLMFFPINLNNLGMTNPTTARIWLIGIIILTHIFIFLISRFIFKSSKRALIVNILYLIWQPFFEGWVLWIDSFLPLLLLPAFYFSIKKNFFLAGLFLGISIVFKQTIIPLSALLFLYFCLDRKNIREVLAYLAGLLIPLFLMISYFFGIGVLWDFWYWNVIFNLTTYAKYGTKAPVESGFISRILFVYSFSLASFYFKEKRIVYTIFIFLFGSFISILDRADFIHLQPSLPFAAIATSLAFYSIKNKKILITIVCVYILVTLWWLNIFYKGHLSEKVFFFDNQTYKVADLIKKYSFSGDKIFIYGAQANLYLLTNTLPAGNTFVFQFPWFLKVAEDRVLNGIKKDQPKIIVFDTSYKVDGVELKIFSTKIYAYIENNYKKIDNIGSIEILQRRIDAQKN